MHAQIRIVHCKRARGCKSDGAVDCLQALLKQLLVVIKTAPAFAVKGISDIELCPRIALRRVCALPFVASRTKLFSPEQIKCGIKFFLIDLVSAGSNFSAGRHLLKRAGLGSIDPDNDHGVSDRECETRDLNYFCLHSFTSNLEGAALDLM